MLGKIETCIGLTDIDAENMYTLEQHENIALIKKILKENGRLDKLEITEPFKGPRWHREIWIQFILKDCTQVLSWKLVQNPAGCGSMILTGYSQFSYIDLINDKNKEILREIINLFINTIKDNGVGAITTVLGMLYFKKEKILEFLEMFKFEEIAEYHNYQHGSGYKQKLLIRIIK